MAKVSGRTDWSTVDAIIARIPEGKWASYGDVCLAAGFKRTHARALGTHVRDLENAWRLLDEHGIPRPRRFGVDVVPVSEIVQWLKEEGIRFDMRGRADDHRRLDVRQLRGLAAPRR